ncbi:hypothetical protein C8A05DRAFT_17086 [Staphylotrichum tortipilum]|uniref:Uncharacterized protein n=1 Tax=Staphylotrichum tortipilum TaxID=2831512 RepID=A0AAN6MIP7_9PEZI|nr:hypothetical protein C8A05DRAFT_17086 [Staphylotrichum longicolle]
MGSGPGLGAMGASSLMASPPTADGLREMREYEKLVRFRDEVLSGAHPRITPTHLPGKAAQKQAPPTAPAAQRAAAKKGMGASGRPVVDSFQSHQANKKRAQVKMASGHHPLPQFPGLSTQPSAPASSSSGATRPLASGKPEINPVLLEKSDDLIKAEIQLQRTRVERSLKDQLDQRRAAPKASEQLAELDVADIMAKAMSLVHATPPVQSTDDTAANASASNDSADDDTFYSSRHDTPESNMASRLPASEDEEMRDGSPYEPELDFEPLPPSQVQPAAALPAQAIPANAPTQPRSWQNAPAPGQAAPPAGVAVPGLSAGAGGSTSRYQGPQVSGLVQSSSGTRSVDSGNVGSSDLSGGHDLARVNERLLDQARGREPPLVRGHDLSPLAPQPTHVLPPAIAREQHLGPGESSGGPQAAPAQVAALRKQTSNASSPESSPHGSKAEKKKNKKKKRKADRLAVDAPTASPYIKPEPRSPSPLTPQYARPNKRQRYSQQQPLEIPDDEPRYQQRPAAPEEGYQERYQPRVIRQERVVGYERADEYRPRHGDEPILITSPRYERVYYDDYRAPPPSGYQAGPEPVLYAAREVRTVRPAARVVEGAPYEDGGATYHNDTRAASRMGVRPAANYPDHSQSPVGYERPPAAMPPPRAPPRRIVVDAFGREYLEPARPATVVREEVVRDARGAYEPQALPPRAISRRPDLLDDGGVIYRPASPAAYAPPRRVVTQPEYAFRDPAAGIANPPLSGGSEYAPREYIARAASVRPPLESPRYDAVPQGYERVHAAPIDAPGSYYRAASARPPPPAEPLARYDAPQYAYERRLAPDEPIPVAVREYPQMRSASVRPPAGAGEARYDLPPREYGAAPAGGVRRVEYAYHDDGGRRAEYAPPSGGVPQQQPPPQQEGGYYGLGQGEEEVVFLERAPRGEYR